MLRDLSSGLLLGIVSATYALSYAALVFAGPLAPWAAEGLTAFLMSGAVAAAIVAWRGSLKVALAGPDTPATAVLAAAAVSLAGAMPPDRAGPAVLLLAAGTAVLAGLILFAVGTARRAQSLRFLPYPVVGGFLAASGWFLIVGAVALSGWDPGSPTDPQTLTAVGVMLAVAAVLTLGAQLGHPPLLVPVTVIVASLLPIGLAMDLPTMASGTEGLGIALTWAWQPAMTVDVGSLTAATGEVVAMILVVTLACVLNTTGLEVSLREQADLDRDFRANGLGNLAAGALGGVPTNVTLNRTLLAARAGGRGRAVPATAALVLAGLLAVGPAALDLVPRPVLAGVLLWLGGSVLLRWVWQERRRLTPADQALLIGIALLVVVQGYLVAVVAGIVAACLIFAVAYARVRTVRRAATRTTTPSRVDRAEWESRFLTERGDAIRIYWLQGFLFFGTAHALLARLRGDVSARRAGEAKRTVVLFDAAQVTGIDSSAAFSFLQIRQLAEDSGVRIGIAAAPPSMIERLGLNDRTGLDATQSDSAGSDATGTEAPIRLFADLDGALEWAEERVLAEMPERERAGTDGRSWLASLLGTVDLADRFRTYLNETALPAGAILYAEGAPADTIDFVVEGRVSVTLTGSAGGPIRLRSMDERTVLGEMGFYRAATRTAAVIADRDSRIWRLDRAALDRLEAADPALGLAVHRAIVRLLADRLDVANRELASLRS